MQRDTMPVAGSRRSMSYLLRVWQEAPGAPRRALLRSVTTREEHVFPNLDGLVAFLEVGESVAQAPVEMDETDEF